MTLVQYDRVMEISTTTGTGTYTLGGAVLGYQSFAAVGDANTCYYCAMGVDGNGNLNGDGWEVGLGTYTLAGTLLARTAVLASTNSNNAVNWAAGTRRIFVTIAAGGAPPLIGTNITGIPTTGLGAGAVVQVVNTQTGAVATGTTTVPMDDTIPQNTEGTEFMTLAITPTNASNKLKIEVVFSGTISASAAWLIVALFQDSTADALAAEPQFIVTGGGFTPTVFTHYMTAGTTSATTFKVRAGGSGASTVTFNGVAASRFLGGVMASSITITEIAA